MKIYVKRAGEELSALKPAITLGSTIPEDVPANNLVLTDGEGGVQNSGVNIDNIDAKTLDGKNSSYYAQKTQIDNILDGTTKVAKAVAADSATSATSASKLSTSAGTATNPVYFKDGVPVATTYALNKTVPSDAKFTDTVYTHPSSHAATMITEDSTHRFVTDAEKTTWNGALSSAKSYTDTKISALIGSAPETLDTLKEIADAITDNQEVIDTLNSAIGNKADGTNGVANNASKLNGQAASYYATAASVTNIVNGTTQVGSAAKVGTIAASSVAEKTWVEDYVTEKMADTGVGDMLASVYDVDGDGTVDDADKLGGQLPSYYAKASDLTTVTSNITKIVDGTTKVAKAIAADSATSATKATQDGNGKVIADTYATVTALNTTNTNVTNITNGTTKVAKATAADSATKATQDASGNVITSTYATKSALDTTNANITKITDGTTTVAKATSATKATQDGNGNVIASTYAKKGTGIYYIAGTGSTAGT